MAHMTTTTGSPGSHVPRSARLLGLAIIALATAYLSVTNAIALRDPFQIVGLCFLIPGAFVVLRRDGHVIGWLLVANGVTWAIHGGTEAVGGGLAWMPVAWRAWLFEWMGYAQWVATIALFVLFPDGMADRTPTQRRTGRAMIAVAVVVTVIAMFIDPVGAGAPYGPQTNPTGLGVLPPEIGGALIIPIGLLGIASVIGLWRRARHVTGVRRRQYTWVLFAFGVVMAGLPLGLIGELIGVDGLWLGIVLGWFLIPTAFSIAILRHRLYDIDRIVSRTVAYALITVVVAGIYAVPVIALPELFGLRGPLPVAAATLTAAAAFSPVRRGVQRWVDRHFNRARFDAGRELDAFTARLRSQVDLDTIMAEITVLVATTLQPSRISTWLRSAPADRPGSA